jgi:hypothetical protein
MIVPLNELMTVWYTEHVSVLRFKSPVERSFLYSLPIIVRVINSRRMRWAVHVAHMGERRGVYRVLVGKPEGKSPLGRPRRRRDDNIKMQLREVGGGGKGWIDVEQDRGRWRVLVNAIMNILVP